MESLEKSNVFWDVEKPRELGANQNARNAAVTVKMSPIAFWGPGGPVAYYKKGW